MTKVKTRVILIEDNALIRTFLKNQIERLDYEVVAEATSGLAALDAINNVPADLILLDLSLPEISGLQILGESKKIRQTKVLIITMHTEHHIIQEALDAGADGICVKDRFHLDLESAMLETINGNRPVYLDA